METREILNAIGYVELQDHGKEYRMRPLYRSSGNSTALCVNKSNGQWYDFSAREGGSILGLVKLTLNLSSLKAAKEYLGNPEIEIEDYAVNKYELSEHKRFDKELLVKLKKDHSYWEGRGISKDILELFNGGTTFNGRMGYRYVFPIIDNKNDLIGFSGRRLNDNPDYPKWKILGKKSNFVYPSWQAQYSKKSIIVESIGDMLSLAEIGIRHVLVAFGVEISPKIIQHLLKFDCQEIFIVMNNDNGNNFVGNLASLECKQSLLKYFDVGQVTSIIPPYKDLNEFLLSDRSAFEVYCREHSLFL